MKLGQAAREFEKVRPPAESSTISGVAAIYNTGLCRLRPNCKLKNRAPDHMTAGCRRRLCSGLP